MRSILVFLFLIIAASTNGQVESIFKDYHFDNSYTLLSISPNIKGRLLYSEYCFILKDLSDLQKVKSSWIIKKKGENLFDASPITVCLIKDKSLVEIWTFSPKYNTISVDGDEYLFNPQLLKNLSKKFPFNYSQHIDTVKTKNDYKLFIQKIKSNPKFVFEYGEPDFKYEGTFNIEFKVDKKINSPDAAIKSLKEQLKKMGKAYKYSVSYLPFSESNSNQSARITLTVESNKDLYNDLKNGAFVKGSWVPRVIEVETYWLK